MAAVEPGKSRSHQASELVVLVAFWLDILSIPCARLAWVDSLTPCKGHLWVVAVTAPRDVSAAVALCGILNMLLSSFSCTLHDLPQ